jgi:hypothetical protein
MAPHSLRCWGFVSHLVDLSPVDGTGGAREWDQVAVGSLSVCAVSMGSELDCWGTGLHDVKRRPTDIIIA